jgi:hypothetical protein
MSKNSLLSHGSSQIKPGTRVELPLWLGQFLAVPYVHCSPTVIFICMLDTTS